MKFLVNSLIYPVIIKFTNNDQNSSHFLLGQLLLTTEARPFVWNPLLKQILMPQVSGSFLRPVGGNSYFIWSPSPFRCFLVVVFFLSFSLGEFSHMHVLIHWLWRNMFSIFFLCSSLLWVLHNVNSSCQCLPRLSNQSPQFIEIARDLHPVLHPANPQGKETTNSGLTPLFLSSQDHCHFWVDAQWHVHQAGREFRKDIHTHWYLKFTRNIDRSVF